VSDLLQRLGATLGDAYQIERELGGGGMSRVYLAHERALGRRVVVKVLPPELAAEVDVERFRREVQIVAQLGHPNIIPVLATCEADGLLYYTMPFVAGESLKERLARERQLSLTEAIQIAREVASALDYAHRQGVFHRDIKPANILLEDGHAVVADFGIARAVAKASAQLITSSGLVVGTPQYMSPEQASGEREVDGRSDIYSLGCVLYEMLAGEPPFAGPTAQAVIAKRFAGPPLDVRVLRPAVPRAVCDVLVLALAAAPADRYPSAREFAAALAAAMHAAPDAEVVTAARGPAPAAFPQSNDTGAAWRRPTRRLVAVVVAVTALGIVGALAARSRRLSAPRIGSPASATKAAFDAKRVTIAEFRNETGDAAFAPLGRITADWIAHGLVQTGLVDLIDAPGDVRPDSTMSSGAVTSAHGLRALAESTGAGTVITGAYYREGDSLRFQAQLTDGNTGKLFHGVGPVSAAVTAPTSGIEVLRQRLMGSLAMLLDPHFSEWSRTALVVPTYEAYREFVSGVDDYKSNGEQALLHFRRASALDPTFHQAQLWEVTVYDRTLSHPNDLSAREKAKTARRRDSVLSLVVAARDQLGPLDRAMLDWRFAHDRGDRLGALRSSREMVRLWPDRWAMNAALDALHLDRPREAKQLILRTDPEHGFMRRWGGYWDPLLRAEHALGEYREELRDVRRARVEDEDPSNSVHWLGIEMGALVGLGRVQEATALAEASDTLAMAVAERWWPVSMWIRLASELHAHGQPLAARPAAERGVAWAKRRPADEQGTDERVSEMPGHLGLLCDALYLSERWDEARAVCGRIATQHPNDPEALAHLASLAARSRDLRAAERYSQQLSRVDLPDWIFTDWSSSRAEVAAQYGQVARARIAALTGQKAEAVRLLQLVTSDFQIANIPSLFLREDPDFDSLRDYPPFEELVRPKG
jgi:tRNA A-37 threonylcarbamoyl transferase component Bud32/tetratricopeptide (TPR) repeat protein